MTLKLSATQRSTFRKLPGYREQSAISLPDRAIVVPAPRAKRGTGPTAQRKAKAAAAFNARCQECKFMAASLRASGINLAWKAPGRPNKLELSYAEELRQQEQHGRVIWWEYEPWSFPIASGAMYCPDFIVGYPDGTIGAIETKGFMREAAALRIKVFRDKYPKIALHVVRKVKGGWVCDEVKS